MGSTNSKRSQFFLTLIFVVSVALIFFLMGLTYKHLQKLSDQNYWVNHSMEISLNLEKLYADLKDIETERRNFLLTNDPNAKNVVKSRITEINSYSNNLRDLLSDNPDQLKNLEDLKKMIAYKYKVVNQSFSGGATEENPILLRESLLAGKSVMASISDKISQMLGAEAVLLKERKQNFLFAERSTPIYLYIISLFSLGLLGFAFHRINKEVKRQVDFNRQLQISLDSANLAEIVGEYGVWILDLKTNTYKFSDNEYRILGYEPNEFEANYENFVKHVHPEDLSFVNEKASELLKGYNPPPFQYRVIRKNGTERIFQASGKKVKDITGNEVILGVTSDITEEIKNKENLALINQELTYYNESSKTAEKIGNYGFWKWDVNNNDFVFSDNIFNMFGIDRENFDPKVDNFIPTVYPEDLDYVYENLAKFANKERNIPPYSHRIIKQDTKELRYIRVSNKLINEDEPTEYYLMITQDITNDILSQQKLANVNEQLTFYNESSKEAEIIGNYGFWRWMVDEHKFFFSDNLFKIFGIEPLGEEATLETFLPMVHPEDIELVEKNIEKLNNKLNIKPFVHRIYRHDNNELRYIKISNKLIKNDKVGEYILFITQDVTDEILTNKSIEEKNRILEANNKELTAFNYVASHDLQEPLRKIETFVSRLKDKDYEKLSDNGKQYLDRTLFSAGRMRSLINDLLQFSRTTRVEQVFEKTDLNVLMENALEDLHSSIEEKGAIIYHEKLPQLKVIPFQIQQLFGNIIGNSLKYSKENVSPKINIKAEKVSGENEPLLENQNSNKFYKITFKDNGIGFENEYSHKIFELFHRLHGKMDYEGTGIGLAICKKIVENHKGYIFAEAVPNEGATFTILLPE